MSTTGFDLPLLPSAEQIRRRMFARVRRGYDPDQVTEYLSQIADQVEHLEAQARESRMASEVGTTRPATERDPASDMADRIADIVRTAERHAEERLREVDDDARRILAEARADADRIRLDAQGKAEEARQQGYEALALAREEADRAVGNLASRRRELVRQFEVMRERLLGIAGELTSVVEPDSQATGDLRALEKPGPGGEPLDRHQLEQSHEALWATSETVDLFLPDLELDASEEDPGRPDD